MIAHVFRELGARALALIALIVFIAVLLSGCSPADEHYDADRKLYDAVMPEHMKYVNADPALDAEQKARRKLAWDLFDLELRRKGK